MDLCLILETREYWQKIHGTACDLWWYCIKEPGHAKECTDGSLSVIKKFNSQFTVKATKEKISFRASPKPRRKIYDVINVSDGNVKNDKAIK